MFIGLFSRNFAVSGAVLLALSKQVKKMKWKDIRKVKHYPRQYTNLVHGGFTQKIALFCTEKNYVLIENTIKEEMNQLI